MGGNPGALGGLLRPLPTAARLLSPISPNLISLTKTLAASPVGSNPSPFDTFFFNRFRRNRSKIIIKKQLGRKQNNYYVCIPPNRERPRNVKRLKIPGYPQDVNIVRFKHSTPELKFIKNHLDVANGTRPTPWIKHPRLNLEILTTLIPTTAFNSLLERIGCE